jgi:hypothetical protein
MYYKCLMFEEKIHINLILYNIYCLRTQIWGDLCGLEQLNTASTARASACIIWTKPSSESWRQLSLSQVHRLPVSLCQCRPTWIPFFSCTGQIPGILLGVTAHRTSNPSGNLFNYSYKIHPETQFVKTCKQSRCPSVDEWVNKLWYIKAMEY